MDFFTLQVRWPNSSERVSKDIKGDYPALLIDSCSEIREIWEEFSRSNSDRQLKPTSSDYHITLFYKGLKPEVTGALVEEYLDQTIGFEPFNITIEKRVFVNRLRTSGTDFYLELAYLNVKDRQVTQLKEDLIEKFCQVPHAWIPCHVSLAYKQLEPSSEIGTCYPWKYQKGNLIFEQGKYLLSINDQATKDFIKKYQPNFYWTSNTFYCSHPELTDQQLTILS